MTPIEEFEAQESGLEPGTEGWWKVWGAQPRHIRKGDIVLTKSGDEVETLYVEDVFRAKAHPVRVGIVLNGERQTIGALAPIILVRRGTHHTLAD